MQSQNMDVGHFTRSPGAPADTPVLKPENTLQSRRFKTRVDKLRRYLRANRDFTTFDP